MPAYAPTVEQLREICSLAREGRTLEELRGLFPTLSPGMLGEIQRMGASERTARLELARVIQSPEVAAPSPTSHAPAPAAGQVPDLPPAPPGYPKMPPGPWPGSPMNGGQPAYMPWWYGAPPAPPAAVDVGAALRPAVEIMSAAMTALVAVLQAERTRSPFADLPVLLAALREQQPDSSRQLKEMVGVFREGMQVGSSAAADVVRDASPTMETVREVAAAINALLGARGGSVAAVEHVAGRPPAAAPVAALPAPPARVAAPGPAWDPRREITAVIDYALRTNDDPRSVARLMRAKLPQDILMTVERAAPADLVRWIMGQREAIPAVAEIPEAEAWVTALVRALRGETGDDEPGELEEDEGLEEDEELEEDLEEDEELEESARMVAGGDNLTEAPMATG